MFGRETSTPSSRAPRRRRRSRLTLRISSTLTRIKEGITFIIIISPISMEELITRPFRAPHRASLSLCLNANLPDIVCQHVISVMAF